MNLDGREKSYPRRAGVSSFGAGGANAHVIVEEYCDEIPSAEDSGEEHIFVLSAKTPAQLRALARSVAEFLSSSEREPFTLRQLAYTSQFGRKEMAERVAFCARTITELAGLLTAFLENVRDDAVLVDGVADRLADAPVGQRADRAEAEEVDHAARHL